MSVSLACLELDEVQTSQTISGGSPNDFTTVTVTAPSGQRFVSGGYKLRLSSSPSQGPNAARVVGAYFTDSFTKWNVDVSGSGETVDVIAVGYLLNATA